MTTKRIKWELKMRTLIRSTVFLFLISVFSIAQQTTPEFPKLTGPYLGQKPPGMTPEIFASGIISTGLNEGVCSFMPDGSEIVFTVIYRKPHSQKIFSSLVTSKMKNGVWLPPEVLEFSGSKYMDGYPFISYDGKELFFQSDRPTNRADLRDQYNIWSCKRIKDGWSEPGPLPSPINGRGNVSGPSMSKSGVFYFTLIGSDSGDVIYESQFKDGKFSEPKKMQENLDSKYNSFDGVISPDGSYYILCVYDKEDSLGGTDLYITFKDDKGNWTPLKNLGEKINTKYNEGSANITADGNYIFFSGPGTGHNYFDDVLSYADILNFNVKPQCGNSDIYWVSAKIIEELKPKSLE
jgi:Tol biopolymer transport system component